MVFALQKDKAKVVEILTAAFVNNKSVNYLIPQDGLKLFRVHELMALSTHARNFNSNCTWSPLCSG